MNCPRCRNENPDDAAFCGVCYEVLRKKPTAADIPPDIEPPGPRGPAPQAGVPAASRAPASAPDASAAPPSPSSVKKYALVAAAAVLAYFVLPNGVLDKVGLHRAEKYESFTATDLQGHKMRLSECEGRPILVYVWTTGSARALDDMPLIDQLYSQYKDGPVCFITVTLDSDFQGAVARFAGAHELDYPVYNGYGYVTSQFWPPYLPMMYLIDRRGYIRHEFSPVRDDKAKIASWLRDYIHDGSQEAELADLPEPPPDPLDPPEASDLLAQQALDLLSRQRYDDLDELAGGLRSSKARFESGLWKLESFYDGLTQIRQPRAGDDDWQRRLAAIQAWHDQRPRSVTAAVALGETLIGYAWYARRGDVAQRTPEEDMRLFEQRLEQAQQVLQDADQLTDKCPELYADMQLVDLALGDDPERNDALFQKAIRFEPSYYKPYVLRAQYLLPFWHGRPGDWSAFAQGVSSAGERNKELYARIVVALMQLFRWNLPALAKTAPVSWPLLRESFLAIEKAYPDGRQNLNQLAWFACQFGDKDTAKAAFAKLGDGYDKDLWRSRLRYERARQWAQTRTLLERLSALLRRA